MSVIEYNLRPRRKRRFKETLKNETNRAIKALITTLTLMIIVLIGAFLVLTNQNAQKGYTLEQAKLENENLKTINGNLSTKITDSTSFKKIEENNKLSTMSEPESKKYVTEEDNRI